MNSKNNSGSSCCSNCQELGHNPLKNREKREFIPTGSDDGKNADDEASLTLACLYRILNLLARLFISPFGRMISVFLIVSFSSNCLDFLSLVLVLKAKRGSPCTRSGRLTDDVLAGDVASRLLILAAKSVEISVDVVMLKKLLFSTDEFLFFPIMRLSSGITKQNRDAERQEKEQDMQSMPSLAYLYARFRRSQSLLLKVETKSFKLISLLFSSIVMKDVFPPRHCTVQN